MISNSARLTLLLFLLPAFGCSVCSDLSGDKANPDCHHASDCDQGQYCLVSRGWCVDYVCDPGQMYCKDQDIYICNATGTAEELFISCGEYETCFQGSCNPDPYPFLTLTKVGQGWVTSTPARFDCATGCDTQSVELEPGLAVTFQAVAACGWTFVGWSGHCDASGQVVVDDDKTCVATFDQNADPGATLFAGATQVSLAPDPTWGMILTRVGRLGDPAANWPVTPGPLWSLELWPVGDPMIPDIIGPDQADGFTCWVRDPEARELELTWTGVEGSLRDKYDLQVTIRPRPEDETVGFTSQLTYRTGSGLAGVGRLDLPLIDFADNGPQTELYVAACGGVRFSDPAASARAPVGDPPVDAPLDLKYPGLQNMRFSALADPDQGLVVVLGVDDPPEERFAIKQFVAGGTDAGDVRMAIGRLPDDPFSPRDLALPGETVLGTVACPQPQACWHAAAGWYRERIAQEGYLERGPMASESPAMQATLGYEFINLVGADVFAGTPADFDEFVTWLDDITTWLGVTPQQTLSIWYDWHANAFDHDLPEHMPPHDNFAPAVAAANAAGYRIMPYTNSTAWGTHLDSYTALDVASSAGVVQRDGTPLLYGHVAEEQSHALDYGVSWVHDYFTSYLFEPLLTDFGLSGFYLDFFPSGIRCFSDSHGHPVGGGNTYIEGVRDYFRLVADLSTQHAGAPLVMSENMGDYIADLTIGANCYRDIDFWGVGDDRMSHVPLFDAVFHDWVQMATIGVSDFPGLDVFVLARDEFENNGNELFLDILRDSHLLTMGWAFAAGHHLVLLRRPIFDVARGLESLREDPQLAILMDFYREAMTLRNDPALKPFLVFGRMAPPPIVNLVDTVDTPVVTSVVLPATRTAVPKVFSYAFFDADGNLAVTLANWDADPATVHLVIDPNQYDMANDGQQLLDTWRVTAYSPGGAIVLTEDLNQNPEWLVPTFDATFPPREPWVLVFERI